MVTKTGAGENELIAEVLKLIIHDGVGRSSSDKAIDWKVSTSVETKGIKDKYGLLCSRPIGRRTITIDIIP